MRVGFQPNPVAGGGRDPRNLLLQQAPGFVPRSLRLPGMHLMGWGQGQDGQGEAGLGTGPGTAFPLCAVCHTPHLTTLHFVFCMWCRLKVPGKPALSTIFPIDDQQYRFINIHHHFFLDLKFLHT